MLINNDLTNCSACAACAAICSKNAITMMPDNKGFLYPQIDKRACVECGKCKEICPVNQRGGYREIDYKQRIFALKAKDMDVYMRSQSGGAFSLMAQKVLARGGIVWGAAFNADMIVTYCKVTELEELAVLKQSKYVQAKVPPEMYETIKQDLLAGTEILFGGTACHIDGLLHYLKMFAVDTERLITCDLVCHGVPAPNVYEKFLAYIEGYSGKKVRTLCFKDKCEQGKTSIIFEDGSKETSSIYMNLFYKNVLLREKCYQCSYANMERISDVTVGDFWGLDTVAPDFWDSRGVSLVMTHSCRGEWLLAEVADETELSEWREEDCRQPNLMAPTIRPKYTERFWAELSEYGIGFVSKKYDQNYLGDQFNYEAIENWVAYAEMGKSVADYFVERGLRCVAVCRAGENDFVDMDKNLQLLMMQMGQAGIYVPFVLDMSAEPEEERVSTFSCDVKRMNELTTDEVDQIDAFVVMDEKYFVDLMERLIENHVPAEKIIPFSFLTAMEV